jgi:hypothetical protein
MAPCQPFLLSPLSGAHMSLNRGCPSSPSYPGHGCRPLSPPCFPRCASPVTPSAGADHLPPCTPRRRQSGKASSVGHLAAHPHLTSMGSMAGSGSPVRRQPRGRRRAARLRRRGRRRAALLHFPLSCYCSSTAVAGVPNASTIPRCRCQRTPAAPPVGSPRSSARSMVTGSSPSRSRSPVYIQLACSSCLMAPQSPQ